MTDKKLADIDPAVTLDGTELVYGVQGGDDAKITALQFQTFANLPIVPRLTTLEAVNSGPRITSLEAVQSGQRLNALEAQAYNGIDHPIQAYGAVDNGATPINTALASAVSLLAPKSTLRMPLKIGASYYNPGPFTSGDLFVDLDLATNITTTAQPPSTARFVRPTLFTVTALKYGYYASSRFRPYATDRNAILNPKDVDDTRLVAIDTTTLTFAQLAAGQYPGTTSSGDTWTSDGLATTGAGTVSWVIPADGSLHGAFIPAVPGDELACYWQGPDNYHRCVIVRGTNGWSVVTIAQDGTVQIVTKAIGANYAASGAVTWQAKTTYLTYHPAFGRLGIRVLDQTHWTLTVGGADVFNGQASLGLIEYIGYGVHGITGGPYTATAYGWVKRQRGVFGGTTAFTVTCWGDSRGEDLHGSWEYYAQDHIEQSLGMRCTNMDIRAIGGHTSAQQLDIFLDTQWVSGQSVVAGNMRCVSGAAYQAQNSGTCGATAPSGFDKVNSVSDGAINWLYRCPSGQGSSLVHHICLGTNDIQGQVTLGAIGVTGSYIDNVYRMLQPLIASFRKIVFEIPYLFYSQANVQTATGITGYGQNTANYGLGESYRLAVERLCASLNVRVVYTIGTHGMMIAEFLLGDTKFIGTRLRDSIHDDNEGYKLRGYHNARAIAAEVTPRYTKELLFQTLPLTYANGWASPGSADSPAFKRAADGIVTLGGIISVGTTTADFTTIATLPAFLRPTQRMIVPASTAATGQIPPQLQINPNGTIQILGWPSSGTPAWVSLASIRIDPNT